MAWFTIDLLVVLIGWASAWLLLWRLPGWGPPVPDQWPVSLSVVVPARDEAQTLPTLLASLAGQNRPADEIIVVDDHSSDGTGRVARAAGVRVIEGEPLPEHWTGKTWACWQGATAAEGDILIFVDADVELRPDALDRAETERSRRGGLVSVQPMHDTGTMVEALSLPFNVVAVMGLGIGSVFPPRRHHAAAGPFMVCRREDYDRVGGHRSVRHTVVEDLALGRLFANAGMAVTCLAGVPEVRFVMYRGGLGEIVRGWAKNFATGAKLTNRWRTVAIALWITSSVMAASWAISGLASTDVGVVTAGLAYAAFGIQYAVLGRQVGRFGPAAMIWPLLVAFFLAVFAWSLLTTFGVGRVRWRGRTVRTTRAGRR